jgi:hypothetical protein
MHHLFGSQAKCLVKTQHGNTFQHFLHQHSDCYDNWDFDINRIVGEQFLQNADGKLSNLALPK